jgi:hypothetical protein
MFVIVGADRSRPRNLDLELLLPWVLRIRRAAEQNAFRVEEYGRTNRAPEGRKENFRDSGPDRRFGHGGSSSSGICALKLLVAIAANLRGASRPSGVLVCGKTQAEAKA